MSLYTERENMTVDTIFLKRLSSRGQVVTEHKVKTNDVTIDNLSILFKVKIS